MNNIEKNPNFENKNINPKIEHLKFIEEKKITDTNGNLVFDVKTFIRDSWFRYQGIIVTPNIPSSELEKLNQALDLCASNPTDPLDLNVIVYNSLDQKSEPLKLGIKDKHRMSIHILPEEFCKLGQNAITTCVENIGMFKEYELGYAP